LDGNSASFPSRPSLPTGLFSCRGIAPNSERLAIHQSGSRDGTLLALCDRVNDANGDANNGRPLNDDGNVWVKTGAPQVFTRMGAPTENGQPVGTYGDVTPSSSAAEGDGSSNEFGNCDMGAPLVRVKKSPVRGLRVAGSAAGQRRQTLRRARNRIECGRKRTRPFPRRHRITS